MSFFSKIKLTGQGTVECELIFSCIHIVNQLITIRVNVEGFSWVETVLDYVVCSLLASDVVYVDE